MNDNENPWPEMTSWENVREAMQLLGIDPDCTNYFSLTGHLVTVHTMHKVSELDLNTVPHTASIKKERDRDYVFVDHHFQVVDHPDLMKLSKQVNP